MCTSFRIHDTDLKYYANGEDAYEMRKYLKESKRQKKTVGKSEQLDVA